MRRTGNVKMFLNGLGALATGSFTLIVVLVAKFMSWCVGDGAAGAVPDPDHDGLGEAALHARVQARDRRPDAAAAVRAWNNRSS